MRSFLLSRYRLQEYEAKGEILMESISTKFCKVKIFKHEDHTIVEKQVNEFLSSFKGQVWDIKMKSGNEMTILIVYND